MKHTYLLPVFAFLLSTVLAACHDEEEHPGTSRPIRITSEVLPRSATEESFTANDEIGIFMLERQNPDIPATLTRESEKWLDNNYFNLDKDGTTWSSLAPVYWKDETTRMDVIGYYPYIDITEREYDVNHLPFNVQTDQSEPEQLRKSDFLYAANRGLTSESAPGGISLSFHHLLCKVSVQLRFNEDELKNATGLRVFSTHVNLGGQIDLNDGKLTVDDTGKNAAITFHASLTNLQAEGILFPQTIPAGVFLTVTLLGDTPIVYNYSLGTPLTLEKEKEYIIDFDCTKR